MTVVRPTAVAGSFYPADAGQLIRQVDGFLADVKTPVAGAKPPKAIIAPHAGYIYSGPIAASAYALLTPLRGLVSRVILLGPSHRVAFRGVALGTAQVWETPLGPVRIDPFGQEALKGLPSVGVLDAAHGAEHSLEVHLPFLIRTLGDVALVPLVVGEASAETVATVLDALWGGPETVIVVSSDLSHYLDYDACRRVDQATAQAINAFDGAAIERDGACGRVPVSGLLLTAKRRGMTIQALDLRNSGDTAGPRDRVVGYGAWALYDAPSSSPRRRLEDLAWSSIRHGLAAGAPLSVPSGETDPLFDTQGACFVTLKRDGMLRGCIGSPVAWRNLGEDVADNAFKSAFRDPRFPPLTANELPGLDLSITVLTPPVPMTFGSEEDLLAQLRPGRDGLIISDGGKSALFIPSVWEQLPNPRDFLTHLKVKAGMGATHWSSGFTARRFEEVALD